MSHSAILLGLLAIIFSLSPSCAYTVSRNVLNYGATGNGVTDDTQAIITALTQGRASDPNAVYPSATYPDSTQTPAYVYFPAGTYLVTQTLPVVYYTQMIGDPANPPTIKFVNNGQVRVLEAFGGWYPGSTEGTDNFYRMIRNFVIDMTQCNQCTGVHWQVAQATSITNVHFKCASGSQCQGMWMENGSGGFFSDLVFEGGIYGMWVGNQQFTSRNITISGASLAAVYINWDWIWTFKGLHVSNVPVGIDGTNIDGSIVVIDSDFTNTPIAFRTKYGTGTGGAGSLYLENVNYVGSGTIVQTAGNNVLTTTATKTVKGWAQGYIWQNGGNTLGTIDLTAQTPARPASLIKADGTYFEQTRPLFVGFTQIDVTTLGLVGDGVTDNTVALQNALNVHVGSVLLFPYGTYLIGNTVVVPPGSRLLGQAWTILMAAGTAFQNANSPVPMLQIGTAGQTGVAQIVDFMISTKGPQPGAKLIEWNLHDPANAPGSNGLWDVHYRIGGADGTGLQATNCPAGDGSNAPAATCTGAWALLHISSTGNAYLENVWGWTADHDIDEGGQVNIYNARGFLCESQGPTWGYGTAFEHSVLYQYNLYNAQDVFLGAIQTETPYYQPSTNTPFNPSQPSDPTYCTNDVRCNMAYALAIQDSSNVFIYGTGLYSFFNVWSTDCLPTSCQESLVYIANTNEIYSYAINTYGAINTYSYAPSYANASSNTNWLLASGIVNLNLFGFTTGSAGGTLPPTTKPATPAPTVKPTLAPTPKPTPPPTPKPTVGPTTKPTTAPTTKPTVGPTPKPTPPPTPKPTTAPTTKPTLAPTPPPTAKPTVGPTPKPTPPPTPKPTAGPTTKPTTAPTPKPTPPPTPKPTTAPTTKPTLAPTLSPSTPPSSGYLVSKSNGLYVTLSADYLVGTATSTSAATLFTFAPISGGYTIQANSNSMYVTADNAGALPLIANRNAASSWETFVFVRSGSYWAIEAFINSNYVALQPSAGNEFIANVAITSAIPDVALFSIVQALTSVNIATATRVQLISAASLAYVTTDGDSLVATGTAQTGVVFNVAAISGGYTLQNSATSFYVSAEDAGASPLVANRGAASSWETFAFVAQQGTYAIVATINNEAVSVQSTNLLLANVANASPYPSSALFYVVAA